MIQFVGIHVGAEAASVAIIGRDLTPTAHFATPMVNLVGDPSREVAEIAPVEWVRAGCYALQEAYFQLPVAWRKPWGIGLSGPMGWIALDLDYEPLSPLRITAAAPPDEDIKAWLAASPRAARRISTILSPKDYFRFAISGGLAADVSSASRLGLLQDGQSQWAEARAAEKGIPVSWLPPVFDCHVPTGRISEEGMRRTSLPSGLWLVAGAHEREAELIAAGDLRDGKLRAISRPGSRKMLTACGIPGSKPMAPPEGWTLVRSAMVGHQILEKELDAPPDAEPLSADHPVLLRLLDELARAGFQVKGAELAAGTAEAGAAALAAVGSGMVKGWDQYYRKRPSLPE